MNDNITYCVRRYDQCNGRDTFIARHIDTLLEAATLALHLQEVQELEYGRFQVAYVAEAE